jgi:hypothetical protein
VSAGKVTVNNAEALPAPSLRANIRPGMSRRAHEANMTPRIPENVKVVGWSCATIMGNMMPPRDPNDDDDDDTEEEDDDAEPEELEPAVVREPDD